MTSRSTPSSSRPGSSKAAKEASLQKEKEDRERAAAEAAAAQAAAEELLLQDDSPPVNYVDIKLHGVFNVPASWTNDSGPPPLFGDHAFRYEVDINVGGKKHTFASGRVLQALPAYEEFVERAELPPPVPQIDPADAPEYTDPRRRAKETYKDVPVDVSKDLPPPPLPSVFVQRDSITGATTASLVNPGADKSVNTPGQSNLASARSNAGAAAAAASGGVPQLVVQAPPANSKGANPAASTKPDKSTKAGPGGAGNNKADAVDPDAPPPIPVGIYWVLGPEHDTDLKEELALRAKEAKQSNAAKKKGEVVQVVEVKPPHPTQPQLCMVRLALSPKQLAHFEAQVEQSVPLTLTFRRVLRGSCPPEWGEDSSEAKFQAKVRIPLTALQRPGTLKMTRVHVPLEPVPPEVLPDEKGAHGKGGKRPGGGGAGGAAGGASAAAKRQKGNAPALLNEDPFLDYADNVHPYTSSKTHAVLSVETFTPITRLPSTRLKPAVDPCDLIPRRVRPPARTADATKHFADIVEQLMLRIVRDQREHKGAVGQQLLGGHDGGDGDSSAGNGSSAAVSPEELRATFLSMLQTTGKIHTYKELLVPAVQQVVRETFLRQPKPSNADVERSASELYTYLMDHVHLKLNELFTHGAKKVASAAAASAPTNTSNSNSNSNDKSGGTGESAATRWARLAKEAEAMGDTDKATRYWQQRLVCGWSGVADPSTGRVPDSDGDGGDESQAATVAAWTDFAEFCLRCRDVIKAEQGYKEAIALDPTAVPALVGYGVLLVTRSRFAEAEVFLQSAVDLAPSVLTWGVLAVFFDALLLSLPNSPEEQARLASCKREAHYALQQAMKLAVSTGIAAKEAESVASAVNNNTNSSSNAAASASANPAASGAAAAQQQQQLNTGRDTIASSAVPSTSNSNGSDQTGLSADNAVAQTASDSGVATHPAQIAVYMTLARYLLQLHHEDLVNVCLSRVPSTSAVDLLYARLFSQSKQFDEAHSYAERIRAAALHQIAVLEQQAQQQSLSSNATADHSASVSTAAPSKQAISTTTAAAAASVAAASAAGGAADHHHDQNEMSAEQQQQARAAKIAAANATIALTHILEGDIFCSSPSAPSVNGVNAFQEAERHYELAFKHDSGSMTGVHFVRLGNCYIRLGKYKDALTAFSYAAKLWPCGLSWLGVGVAYYRMDDLARAELALNESNVMNNLCTRTWAFLALVCFRQKRETDGDQAFNQAIKLGLSDAALMAEIGAEQSRLGRQSVAEACYRRALALHDEPNVRMQLARLLLQMRRLGDAKAEFLAVARTTTNDTQRQRAEEQAAAIAAVTTQE